MKILIEEYGYDKEVVRNALPENHIFLTNGKVKIEYVGYYHNANSTKNGNDDFVFFLPKVVLDKDNRVFKTTENPLGFSPEEIVDPDNVKRNGGQKLDDRHVDFLYGFSVWIYRALARYLESHPKTDTVWASNDMRSGAFRRKYVTNTFLDVILALIRFNRENQDYFLFKIKEKHSGLNKISWARTIAHSTAYVSNGVPVYLEPVNKKRAIDFDEELLVIYYSILAHVRSQYGFRVNVGMGYDLIVGDRFKRYLDGYGVARLRQIKYKYFSDRDLMLWELCFAFFDKAHQANIASSGEDYLLAKNFNIVFEAMIDELLGDPQFARYKDLPDGKEIDHLYVDESLTRTDGLRTLCIADSKYYKIGNALEAKSVAKQFTYAHDMLQLDLDLFLYDESEITPVAVRRRRLFSEKRVDLLRDKVTEGYDVLPNFFISATMDDNLDYDNGLVKPRGTDEGREYQNIHFENRLFDRDTMILSHFDVNFLYVVKLFVQNDDVACAKWRQYARGKFRDEIRDIISHRYTLYALMPHEGIDAQQFFHENFKYTAGKVYSPYPNDNSAEPPIFVLALQRSGFEFPDPRLSDLGRDKQFTRIKEENDAVLRLIKTAFYVSEDVPFGNDPREDLNEIARKHPVTHGPSVDMATGVQVVSGVSGGLKNAVEASGWCPCPAAQCPDPEAVKLLVLPHTMGANLYRVIDGTLQRDKTVEDIKRLTEDAFGSVHFPSMPCHLWRVENVES